MIKVVFTYVTKKENIGELMDKFAESATNPLFRSDVTNEKIEMFKQEKGDDVYIVLDIYYKDEENYKIRTNFERSIERWNEIWFNENNKHKEVSIEVFEVINR